MNRRSFLSLLGLGATAMVLDPELALWKPGATTHILPPPQGWNLSGYNPLPVSVPQIAQAVKALADKIDADALRIYEEKARHALGVGFGRGYVRVQTSPQHFRIERIVPHPVYIDPGRKA